MNTSGSNFKAIKISGYFWNTFIRWKYKVNYIENIQDLLVTKFGLGSPLFSVAEISLNLVICDLFHAWKNFAVILFTCFLYVTLRWKNSWVLGFWFLVSLVLRLWIILTGLYYLKGWSITRREVVWSKPTQKIGRLILGSSKKKIEQTEYWILIFNNRNKLRNSSSSWCGKLYPTYSHFPKIEFPLLNTQNIP